MTDEELLRRLVAFDTTSHRSNLPIAEFLADYLDRPGVRTTLLPSPDGEKANLLVAIGPPLDPGDSDTERRGLVLSGHMDVVPAGDSGWEGDPFTLRDAGDRWVARGSADMKGFLALAANRLAGLRADRLAAPLVLLFTYDEEVGTIGAEHLVHGWDTAALPEVLPRATIIGEPTELRVVAMHKGHLKLRIELTGRSAHSGYPHLGRSAIEAGGRVIAALTALRHELASERPEAAGHFPEVPFAALNVGIVRGGTAVNVVPESCRLEVGIRILPGMSSAEVAERVKTAALGAAQGDASGVEIAFERLSDSPPLAVRSAAPILSLLGELTGETATEAVSYATDAGWLQRLGLDCAIFGPGSITVAHQPEEHLPKADLAAAGDILDAAIDRLCAA